MKGFGPIKYILSVVLLLLLQVAAAQQDSPPARDDEFGIFLLVIGTVFMCAMLGAAIVGAMLAALIVIVVLGLIAVGVISVSFTVGLYNRSFTAGFKTLLVIVFGFTGSVLGIAIAVLARSLFDWHLSNAALVGFAGVGGFAGGVVISFTTYKLLQTIFLLLSKKARLK